MATTDAERLFVDTNVLLAVTHRRRATHRRARQLVETTRDTLYTSTQVMREYLVVATRPFEANGLGLELSAARSNLTSLAARVRLVHGGIAVWHYLDMVLDYVPCRGKTIHDAYIVATALAHGMEAILTLDARDFARFTDVIEVRDLADDSQA